MIDFKSSNSTKPNKKKYRTLVDQIGSFILKFFDLIRSILIRLVFGIHALIAICIVCYVKQDTWYLVNSVGVVFLIIEWFIIAFRHGGKDLPMFSPSFFIYITTLIPPTWFLELENIKTRKSRLLQSSIFNNQTTHHQYLLRQTTKFFATTLNPNLTDIDDGDDDNSNSSSGIDSSSSVVLNDLVPNELKQVVLNATIDQYAIYIEVTMMLIIIIGRWIMPKQGITRSELSQLLLVYMSLASDIIDLLSILQEQVIFDNMTMVYTALTMYSWSLYQFTLNLVVTRGRYLGSSTTSVGGGNIIKARLNNRLQIHNEFLNVIITLLMQDCPFFILRLICVFKFNIFSYSFLFFTFKNGILFVLQIYRIIAIFTDKDYNYDPNLASLRATATLIANEQDNNTNNKQNDSIDDLIFPLEQRV